MNPYKMVITVANQKGGCAKTTTAVNIATALAKGNKELGFPAAKVLLVDLDPQGNVSTSFGIPKSALNYTVYDLLMNDLGEELPLIDEYLIGPEIIRDYMREAWRQTNNDKRPPETVVKIDKKTDKIVSSGVDNLWILPSSVQLAAAEIELATRIGRETRLKEGLAAAFDEFDYIIIDTSPSLGLLTINAMAASNWILIPLQTEYYALEGLSQLMNSIKLVQRRINPNLKLFGIALTMFEKTKLGNMVSNSARDHFPNHVFKSVIPRATSVAAAPSVGAPITLLKKPTKAKANKGSQAYWALGKEVHQRVLKIRHKYGINEPNRLRQHRLRTSE